jgi:autotransporter family porin
LGGRPRKEIRQVTTTAFRPASPGGAPRRTGRIATIACLLLAAVGAFVVAGRPTAVEAARATGGGWTTWADAPVTATTGRSISVAASVRADVSSEAVVDLEIHAPDGRQVFQRYWSDAYVQAGGTRSFTATWAVPSNLAPGTYAVRIGVFSRGWGQLWHWNHDADAIAVTVAPPPTTAPPTTAPPTTAPPTTAPPTGRFVTLAPGSALPSSSTCAARVRPAAEIRPTNGGPNTTRGYSFAPTYDVAGAELSRVDGNFVGTTDELIQWAACKWGIDEDVVRAQMAKESWWNQFNLGDWGSYPANQCPPGHAPGADGRPGECPQSVGIGQVRYNAGDPAFPGVERSTAMNLDYTYAIWRACFDGKEYWLNHVERAWDYGAGDLWGCVGRWFSGRWHTPAAEEYISAVRGYYDGRIWEQSGFQNL